MAEVDPKLCIALDDINEAMDCENQDNMGGIIPSVIFGYHADGHMAGLPEKDGIPSFS